MKRNKSSKAVLERFLKGTPEISLHVEKIIKAIDEILKSYKNDGKLMTCGNGGSASDAEHILGELMKGFLLKRPILPWHKELILRNFNEDTDELSSCLPFRQSAKLHF